MVAWKTSGSLSHFTKTLNGWLSSNPTAFPRLPKTSGSRPVTWDSQLTTRLQYNQPSGVPDRMLSDVTYAYSMTDAENWLDQGIGQSGRWGWWAAMFVVEAGATPSDPAPSQILAAKGVKTYRGTFKGYDGNSNDLKFSITGPRAAELKPNTKYWALLMPTYSKIGTVNSYPNGLGEGHGTPSVANDRPINPGTENSIGRVISFWTNRTPKAPVITFPTEKSIMLPGTNQIRVRPNPDNPDAAASADPVPSIHDDAINGVQLQYAAVPPAGESPVWRDFQCATIWGAWVPSWGIMGSTHMPPDWPAAAGNKSDPELQNLRHNMMGTWMSTWRENSYGFRVFAGRSITDPFTNEPYEAGLPSGDWMLRARVFDTGSPYYASGGNSSLPAHPYGVRPINGAATAWTPDNYPASNKSPWSAVVTFTIPTRLPLPIPKTPALNEAIALRPATSAAGDPELRGTVNFSWLFRSNSGGQQARYQIAYKRVSGPSGASQEFTWNGTGASTSITLFGGPFNVVGQFEWRIRVSDVADDSQSDPAWSGWSDPQRFWIVPAPLTAAPAPDPNASIEGATLGCGTHRVYVYRRGGVNVVGEITGATSVQWERRRDDISTAKIDIAGWGPDCGALLASLQPWAHEIVIFRDNGFSKERVWEGPITLLTYEKDSVTVQAKDVMAVPYRRIIKTKISDGGTGNSKPVVDRAARVLQQVLAPDDPNILKNLTVINAESSSLQFRSVPAYGRTAFEEIDDMASNAGLDYTVTGRSILLWGTKDVIGRLPELRDEDLGSTPIVSVYGMNFANRYAVTNGDGVWGEALRGPLAEGEVRDSMYGNVEILSSTWTSDDGGSTVYDEEGLAKIKESYTNFAERSISDKNPMPVVVRIPANTSLQPDTPISIQHLVPGVVVPIRSSGTLLQVSTTHKLDTVQVTETGGRETISITVSPFNTDDQSTEIVDE